MSTVIESEGQHQEARKIVVRFASLVAELNRYEKRYANTGGVRFQKKDAKSFVGTRIRQLRTAAGLSLRELARRADLPPESVSRAERNVTGITVNNLGKICMGLGISLTEFFKPFHHK